MNIRIIYGNLFLILCCVFMASASIAAQSIKDIESVIGSSDSLLVTSSDGTVLAAKNENNPLVPASTLKILTSLCAIHYLGEDYRFPVKFYLRDNKDLIIEGFGDPLLVSEVIGNYCKEVSGILKSKGIKSIRNIITDDSYFDKNITIPGATIASDQPYDAPVGALSVNFNSISFKTVSKRLETSESQTPLTPTALGVAKKSGLKSGRIPLPPDRRIINAYSGEIFRHFLEKAGTKVSGIQIDGVKGSKDVLIHTAYSQHNIKKIASKLLEFSSNFMANQVFLAIAGKYSGSPASLEGGTKAAKDYTESILGIKNLSIVEGSGLSRQNKITALQMEKILEAFYPFHELMKHKNGAFFKTGTLDGVSTRAGYIETESGEMHKFVIFLNTNGKNAEPVLGMLKDAVNHL